MGARARMMMMMFIGTHSVTTTLNVHSRSRSFVGAIDLRGLAPSVRLFRRPNTNGTCNDQLSHLVPRLAAAEKAVQELSSELADEKAQRLRWEAAAQDAETHARVLMRKLGPCFQDLAWLQNSLEELDDAHVLVLVLQACTGPQPRLNPN